MSPLRLKGQRSLDVNGFLLRQTGRGLKTQRRCATKATLLSRSAGCVSRFLRLKGGVQVTTVGISPRTHWKKRSPANSCHTKTSHAKGIAAFPAPLCGNPPLQRKGASVEREKRRSLCPKRKDAPSLNPANFGMLGRVKDGKPGGTSVVAIRVWPRETLNEIV
jgi:hypothetical protein